MPYMEEFALIASPSDNHNWEMKPKERIEISRGIRETRQMEEGGKHLRFFAIT